MRSIVTAPAAILSATAKPIEDFATPWLYDLVADMARIRRAMGGAGIAAPQVGESVRLFLLDAAQRDETVLPRHAGIERLVVANPCIVRHEGQPVTGAEGCLSIPSTLVSGGRIDVRRSPRIVWRGSSLTGSAIGGTLDGFAARAFQHEVDHLDGILITDHIVAGPERQP